MSRRKFARWAVPALAVMLAVAAVPAMAAPAPNKAVLKTVGKTEFKANAFIKDGLHFNLNSFRIRKGGTLTLVDTTKAPHTFSIVKKGQVPGTARQVENCFGKGPCDEIAIAHGAINPDTGEDQDPTTPLVNAGRAGFNQPGDSVLIPPGGKAKVKITGSNDLYYICAIHPWMQGKVNVAG